jgi:hypothetical protein
VSVLLQQESAGRGWMRAVPSLALMDCDSGIIPLASPLTHPHQSSTFSVAWLFRLFVGNPVQFRPLPWAIDIASMKQEYCITKMDMKQEYCITCTGTTVSSPLCLLHVKLSHFREFVSIGSQKSSSVPMGGSTFFFFFVSIPHSYACLSIYL